MAVFIDQVFFDLLSLNFDRVEGGSPPILGLFAYPLQLVITVVTIDTNVERYRHHHRSNDNPGE